MGESLLNWDAVVDSYYRPIFAFCAQFLGSRDDAHDAVQDTFLKAFRNRQSISGEASDSLRVKHWIYRIARNVCIDRKRWWKRLLNFKEGLEIDEIAVEDRPLSISLRKMIASLPVKQREVFILRHWHGFSTSDTAALLKIDAGTVKSHLSRAISKLKQDLLKDDFFNNE